ncbi:MAG: YraN family protein [Planctomycetes bacterium]|nr:YraN family protein [Planctomycetota bacterium]
MCANRIGPRSLWIKGEDLARKLLKKRGYKILKRNYVCKYGEIDIVAFDRGVITFVEVKARLSESYGSPELAVTNGKKRKIVKTALSYLSENRIPDADYRFDVVSILFTKEAKDPIIELFQGAFSSDGLFGQA